MSTFRKPPTHNTSLVWYARCPTLTATGLVANRGVFQREFLRENVDMVSVRENSTLAVRQGHLDHSLPNLIREADAATALWAYGQNERSRLLAIGQTWHTISVVTRPHQPIHSLKDLAGYRLSLPREAGLFSPAQARTLRAWETILARYDIPARDIEFAPVVADHPSVPFGDIARREVEALLGGHTDVAILFGAKGLELARSAHLKEIHRFTPDETRNDARLGGLVELRALTVDHPFLEADSDIVTRIVSSLIEAANWAQAFPKEALKQVALEGRVELEDAGAAYGAHVSDGAQLGLEPGQIEALRHLQTWMQGRHLLREPHNLEAWVRPDILAAARVHTASRKRAFA